MGDTIAHVWTAVTTDFWVWLIRALITTAAVSLMWWFWDRVRRGVRRAVGEEAPAEPAAPATDWTTSDVLRLRSLGWLRSGVTVAEGSRVLVFDRGVLQCDFRTGVHAASAVARRLRQHAVGQTALVVQVSERDVTIERTWQPHGAEVPQAVQMALGIDASRLPAIKDALAARQGLLTRDDLHAFVDEVAAPAFDGGGGFDAFASHLASRLHDEWAISASVQVPPVGGAG